MTTLILSFIILGLAIVFMAIGVIARKNKAGGELRGSCGGPQFNPNCCMKKDCKQ